MVKILNNISLKPYNTFGLDVNAKHFVSVNSVAQLKTVLSNNDFSNYLFLGGGSNILLTKNVDALVIHLNLKGITTCAETKTDIEIDVAAGEKWHNFVLWSLKHNLGGLENLSLIPGNVGTSPIQNIGAYGVELKDIFVSCKALNIETLELKEFSKADCNFGYRDSIFKQKLKGKFIITEVRFKLTKQNHQLKTNYGAIQSELDFNGIKNPTIHDVSKAVIAIRSSKLPDPSKIGNSGSFFKNPVISKSHFEQLKVNFPDLPCYSIDDNNVKVPAGWLIEHLGFKGKRLGNYGVHHKQALVLVNYGDAKGEDIFELSKLIQQAAKQIFSINLETEVNIL